MAIIFEVLVWVLAISVAIPLLVLAVECLIAFVTPAAQMVTGDRATVAVLIPAHDESSVIGRTIENVRSQLRETDRIVVVADNCSDDTAAIARDWGAEVVERCDLVKRGKGFALDVGVRYIANCPPEAVVIVDADCWMEAHSIDQLAIQVRTYSCPVQGLYLMQLPEPSGPEAFVSTFAFLIKNWVRAKAMHRAHLPVLLTGSGMAFPWTVIADVPLASGEIVEDLAMGLELTKTGMSPRFCETAKIWSNLPSNANAAIEQRTRWEHGYLAAIVRDVPSLIWHAMRTGRISLFLVALDLAVPPLSLLALFGMLATASLFSICLYTGKWNAFWLLASCGMLAAFAIGLGWARFGKTLVPAKLILSIPMYVLGKLNIYKRFVTKRQKEWVRTERG